MQLRKITKQALYTLNRNWVSKTLFNKEIQKRSRLKLSAIEELSKPISMFAPFTDELHPPNDWYGHAHNLKKYLGLSERYQFKFLLEHGLYLNDQVDQIDLETNLPSFVTYSDYRKEILKKYRPYTFAIGPFIHYAESILSKKEIASEKKRLGKSVLFFPAHSTPLIGMKFDVKGLCKKIKKLSKGFDTIRVCIYWKDVLLGRDKIYRENGFECVSAGHMLDPNFLPRLKSLILISDLTASNIISSQAGFCIFLNRPHILINDKLELDTTTKWQNRLNEVFKSEGYLEVAREFARLNFKISAKQKSLIKKYWGPDNIKSKTELEKIVRLSEKYYKKNK